MAERLGGSLKRIGLRDDWHNRAAGDGRDNLFRSQAFRFARGVCAMSANPAVRVRFRRDG